MVQSPAHIEHDGLPPPLDESDHACAGPDSDEPEGRPAPVGVTSEVTYVLVEPSSKSTELGVPDDSVELERCDYLVGIKR